MDIASARRAFCSTIRIAIPEALISPIFSKIVSTATGERPADGSSSSRTSGAAINARASASI